MSSSQLRLTQSTGITGLNVGRLLLSFVVCVCFLPRFSSPYLSRFLLLAPSVLPPTHLPSPSTLHSPYPPPPPTSSTSNLLHRLPHDTARCLTLSTISPFLLDHPPAGISALNTPRSPQWLHLYTTIWAKMAAQYSLPPPTGTPQNLLPLGRSAASIWTPPPPSTTKPAIMSGMDWIAHPGNDGCQLSPVPLPPFLKLPQLYLGNNGCILCFRLPPLLPYPGQSPM